MGKPDRGLHRGFVGQGGFVDLRRLAAEIVENAAQEFADVKLVATHVHGPGVFHTTSKPIRTLADLKGMKVRAPTRQTNRFPAALGATPVAMPVPQVGEALSKGVIDGAVIPWEVVPSDKVQELTKFHIETDPARPAFYTSTFIFATCSLPL